MAERQRIAKEWKSRNSAIDEKAETGCSSRKKRTAAVGIAPEEIEDTHMAAERKLAQ